MPDDAVRAVAGVAASQHGAISRRQAAEAGLTAEHVGRAMRAGWLREPVPGVLVLAASGPAWRRALAVATLARRGRSVASHRAAARLHGLDGFEACPVLEVSVERPHRAAVIDGVVAHHVATLAPSDVVQLDGIRCTSLARTLADLGSVVPVAGVRRALTDARRRDVSLRWLRAVATRLHRPGQSGTGRLLRLLDAVPTEATVPGSWFEELLAGLLAAADLPRIVPQHELRDDRGRFVARFDLAVPAVRLGLEAHSRRFHFGPDAEPAAVVAMVRSVVAARRREV